jgi:hypothetical protein
MNRFTLPFGPFLCLDQEVVDAFRARVRDLPTCIEIADVGDSVEHNDRGPLSTLNVFACCMHLSQTTCAF